MLFPSNFLKEELFQYNFWHSLCPQHLISAFFKSHVENIFLKLVLELTAPRNRCLAYPTDEQGDNAIRASEATLMSFNPFEFDMLRSWFT